MSGDRHATALAQALAELLGVGTAGEVAFLRCLPTSLIDQLSESAEFSVPAWSVFAVVDKADGRRRITADIAVERREDKGVPVLLLVDPIRAGAGLDGIYSAAHEIGEDELFEAAQRAVRKTLPRSAALTEFIRVAQTRARRLGRKRLLAPWQVFDFVIAVGAQTPGAALSRLGLWPVAGGDIPDANGVELSAKAAERLLFALDSRPATEKVRALLLDDPTGETSRALETFLRASAGRSPAETALELEKRPDLWLGPLEPRFSSEQLVALRIMPWRGPTGRLLKWSGLIEGEESDDKPRLILDRSAPAKEQGRLEVRWTTEPGGLKRGAAEYRVVLRSGEDELATQTVTHAEKPAQQAAFVLDDFEDLESEDKFEVVAVVSVIGDVDVAELRSEEFIIEFGRGAGKSASSTGRIVRTLVEGAIGLPDREIFDETIVGGHLPPRATEDRKGYIS